MKHAVVQRLIESAKAQAPSTIERALLAAGALPIPWAWEGCFGVRANGEVVYVDENGNSRPLEAIGNVRENTLATLVYAAKRNPDLKCLLPQRPAAARACGTCGGTGIVTKAEALCGECFGLGWVYAA